MNKRIQELQGKTLDKHFSHTWTNMDYVDLSKFAEKFAELIVKETLQVARAGIEYGPSMEEVVYKYFGVE